VREGRFYGANKVVRIRGEEKKRTVEETREKTVAK
jgi:hypothetical protein